MVRSRKSCWCAHAWEIGSFTHPWPKTGVGYVCRLCDQRFVRRTELPSGPTGEPIFVCGRSDTGLTTCYWPECVEPPRGALKWLGDSIRAHVWRREPYSVY
jgi:hypothetical protein